MKSSPEPRVSAAATNLMLQPPARQSGETSARFS